MEIAPGIHRIEAPLGPKTEGDDKGLAGRYIACYLIVDGDSAVLIDTGVGSSPADTLLPYLASIGKEPDIIDVIVTTHADFDHSGGNGAIADAAPRALFACHVLDRPMIDDVETMITDRYGEFERDYGISYGEEFNQSVRDNAVHVRVDLGLRGNEAIRVGRGRELLVLHVPGHSRGHLSLYDPTTRSLMIGDAVLGRAVPLADGTPALPPTYRYVDSYLSTIERLEALDTSLLLTSHYRVFEGEDSAAFLAESRSFAEEYERAIIAVLQDSGQPLTATEVIAGLSEFGEWPRELASFTAYPVAGHLERLRDQRMIDVSEKNGVMAFQWL